ncbi:hypothetical protein H4V97_001147 [Flavobacterium sp. CG_23.5]|uniref:hypothetical protein n=1 Tax=unclassified Flavobacterium TaxID=196869 RepID=UPI0018CBB9F7|nr:MULTISPECIES: hypothetical protein [unclassified Flavobacterium]MBG6110767.1 hypothetical protein [Flavobacterium sp. CG_9.10]MBP2282829.1 hypothetical protein [Flavobacterium sp. CG_23.5]
MESKDLGSKKTNNKQNINEGFSSENLPEDYNPSTSNLKEEVEIDANGNEKIVQRARNVDGTIASIPEPEERTWNENESLSRGVSTEKEVMRTVENEDHNSDITANRYPNEHPDNKEDRGNIKLDE